MNKIHYICPLLGERVLITFSDKSCEEELNRLRKLDYEITSVEKEDD